MENNVVAAPFLKTLILLTYSDTYRRWIELSREVFTDAGLLAKSEAWALYCGGKTRVEDGDTKTEPTE
jgi:hypothetical protein